jgi:hypothetical protein
VAQRIRGSLRDWEKTFERELKSSEFLRYIEIIGFFVAIGLCYPHGMTNVSSGVKGALGCPKKYFYVGKSDFFEHLLRDGRA